MIMSHYYFDWLLLEARAEIYIKKTRFVFWFKWKLWHLLLRVTDLWLLYFWSVSKFVSTLIWMSNLKFISWTDSTHRLIENGDLWKALSNWQQEMKFMHSSLKLINLYDFTRARSDVSEQNFWHFLQKSEVREAIHVGNTFFDGGSRVLNR